MVFSAKLYDASFGNAKGGSHPPPPVRPKVAKHRIRARVTLGQYIKRQYIKKLRQCIKYIRTRQLPLYYIYFSLLGLYDGSSWNRQPSYNSGSIGPIATLHAPVDSAYAISSAVLKMATLGDIYLTFIGQEVTFLYYSDR